jgi:hypothetical protein
MTDSQAGPSPDPGPARGIRPRAGRVTVTVVSAVILAVGAAAFAFFGFLAWFGMCGVSGCSGGGFGRSTDPGGTQLMLALAGTSLLVALLLRAALRRNVRSAAYAVVLALVATVALGAVIGSDWRGCPRSISHASCLAESR